MASQCLRFVGVVAEVVSQLVAGRMVGETWNVDQNGWVKALLGDELCFFSICFLPIATPKNGTMIPIDSSRFDWLRPETTDQ